MFFMSICFCGAHGFKQIISIPTSWSLTYVAFITKLPKIAIIYTVRIYGKYYKDEALEKMVQCRENHSY